MADVFSKSKRSEVMSRIRGRGNKDTELALAMLLRRHRISGWRRQLEIRDRAVGGASVLASHRLTLTRQGRLVCSLAPPKTGAHRAPLQKAVQQRRPAFRVRPDFVFPKLKLTIFVDGCFWHGCPKHCNQPANNRMFWQRKLTGNVARDRLVIRTLRRAGWRVLRVWEHELARKNQTRLVARLSAFITG